MPMKNKRMDFYPVETLVSQVQEVLETSFKPPIDWITLVGSGETTLYASIGTLIHQIKSITPIPIAVITNGSLLYQPEVRAALAAADAVLPSFDAGNPTLYRRINRPHPDIHFNRMKEGLTAFRKEYHGKLWVEIMLILGLNDTEEALREIAGILNPIEPDEIHLLLPTRPPSEPWVKPTDEEGMLRAAAILGHRARMFLPSAGTFSPNPTEDLMNAIISIITRHPMKESEIIDTHKKWPEQAVLEKLNQLEQRNQILKIDRYGIRFWRGSY